MYRSVFSWFFLCSSNVITSQLSSQLRSFCFSPGTYLTRTRRNRNSVEVWRRGTDDRGTPRLPNALHRGRRPSGQSEARGWYMMITTYVCYSSDCIHCTYVTWYSIYSIHMHNTISYCLCIYIYCIYVYVCMYIYIIVYSLYSILYTTQKDFRLEFCKRFHTLKPSNWGPCLANVPWPAFSLLWMWQRVLKILMLVPCCIRSIDCSARIMILCCGTYVAYGYDDMAWYGYNVYIL
jgi:hypothetical protein